MALRKKTVTEQETDVKPVKKIVRKAATSSQTQEVSQSIPLQTAEPIRPTRKAEPVITSSSPEGLAVFQPQSSEFWKSVAERAYFLAEKRGFQPGHELNDWLEAESEIKENWKHN